MQRELLDTRRWPTKADLAAAIFEWIEPGTTAGTPASACSLSPAEFEALHTQATSAA